MADTTTEKAKITVGQTELELPVVVGSEGERAVDISDLRAKTKFITLDHGYGNTGSCLSDITFINGEKGILRYRGIPIEQLAEQSSFVETAFLLINGHLPSKSELDGFSADLESHAALHDDVGSIFNGIPAETHPMAVLSSMVSLLSGFHPGCLDPDKDEELVGENTARLLSKVRTIAAYTFRKSLDQPFVRPDKNLSYCANFLHMMFSEPGKEYKIDEDIVKALNLLLILHADHEQNCSASTVRLVGSSRSNIFASISAGIGALWGPWHGGANQDVMQMLQEIQDTGKGIDDFIRIATDPDSKVRLSGFGHRVYKTFDPRANVIKHACHGLIDKLGINDPLLEIAMKLEEAALKHDFFVSRKLYPNVDFYSGLIYKLIGLPTNMYTVMFAIGRMPGWIAHWKEMREFKPGKIGRPRQIYTGRTITDYTPLDKR